MKSHLDPNAGPGAADLPKHSPWRSRRDLILRAGAGLAAGALPAVPAGAQPIRRPPRAPVGPARFLVGAPVGSRTDILARAVAEMLRVSLNGGPTVDNLAADFGQAAREAFQKAPLDASTVLVLPENAVTIVPHITGKPGYGPRTDLIALGPLAYDPLVLTVGPRVPTSVINLETFVAWCRQAPGRATYAVGAPNSVGRFFGSKFAQVAGFGADHVACENDAAAIRAVAGGQIAWGLVSYGQVLSVIDSVPVRMLALSAASAQIAWPGLKTFAESGFALQALSYDAVYARAGTPLEAVQRATASIRLATTSTNLNPVRRKVGMQEFPTRREDFAAMIDYEYEKWEPVVRDAGYRPFG